MPHSLLTRDKNITKMCGCRYLKRARICSNPSLTLRKLGWPSCAARIIMLIARRKRSNMRRNVPRDAEVQICVRKFKSHSRCTSSARTLSLPFGPIFLLLFAVPPLSVLVRMIRPAFHFTLCRKFVVDEKSSKALTRSR